MTKEIDLLTVFNMDKPKKTEGLKVLIGSMVVVDKAVLHIVGRGHLIDDIREHIKVLGLERKVILHGETKDIHSYYRSADIFIFITGLETFGQPVIEAMYYDLPIIASDNFSMPELLFEHKDMLVELNPYDIADKINKTIQSLPMKVNYPEKERFGWDNIIQETRGILDGDRTRDGRCP